jgi:hypothetical protein
MTPMPKTDKQDHVEFRKVFAETGHRTLNALLIVSGGAAVSFMTFLGNALKEREVALRVGPAATSGFVFAMQLFIASVACAVLAHGTTYASHGFYYFHKDTAGAWLMGVTILLGLACILSFCLGSYAATRAFEHAAEVLVRHA